MKILEVLKRVAIEFCSQSSLHGVKYLVEFGRSRFERLFWIWTIILATTGTVFWVAYSIHIVIMPNDSAVITSIMSTNFPSYALEQPTVTICSPYKVVKSRVDEFFRIMTFDSDIQKYELEQTISIFAHYLQRNKPDISKKSNKSVMIIIMKWTDFLEKNYWTISDFLIFHHQPCDEFILKCYVARKPTICSDIFRVSKTRYGLCCSYDYLQTRDALLLKVNPPLKKRRNNFRQYNGLFEDGITFLLNLSHQNPIYSSNEYNAALVYLHSRDDYPFVYTNAAWISSGIEMVYRYSINAMVSSTAVKNLDPSLRKCYSRDEVKLKFFDHYTLENCNIEADMELMIEKCNCLLTRYPNQGFVKDCTVYNSFCYHSLGIDYSFYHKKFVNINGKRMQCLERCNYVRHIPTSNSAPIADPELNSYGVWDDIKNITGLALFSLFRGSTESVVYEKTLTATNLELIVWISGFAGVIFGMNQLCLFEFIYFFLIRFFRYLKQFNSTTDIGESDNQNNVEEMPTV